MDFAFSFIIRNGGLDTEKDYRYKAAGRRLQRQQGEEARRDHRLVRGCAPE